MTEGVVVVELGWAELVAGGFAGVMRCVSGRTRNRTRRYGLEDRTGPRFNPSSQWARDCDSSVSEKVVARYLGLYWTAVHENGKLDRAAGDVGPFLEVRAVDEPHRRLLVHHEDDDDSMFYSVLCEVPRYTIRGWIWGREAKREEWWDTKLPTPAFAVPNAALHPCQGGAEVPDRIWLAQRGRVA